MNLHTITLRDGRTLAWAEYGASDGVPVLLFHGTPGSRLDHDAFDRPTRIRLIVPDRPGFGMSDPQPGRRLVEWPDDVAQLADALGLGRFHVAGISGGGPYALVCAALMPDRVLGAAVICGVGPLEIPELREGMNEQNVMMDELARSNPAAVLEICDGIAQVVKADVSAFIDGGLESMVPIDRETVAIPEVRAMFATSVVEALRQGGVGFADDMVTHASPWGFDPATIAVPVHLVHGALDRNVPVSNAEYLARVIPGAKLRVLPDQAHMSIAIHWSVPTVEGLIG